jgi:hypothetical protein
LTGIINSGIFLGVDSKGAVDTILSAAPFLICTGSLKTPYIDLKEKSLDWRTKQ